jgi:glycosyltransferase involved in cell wall biosynthesis
MISLDVVLHVGDDRNLFFWVEWLLHLKGILEHCARARFLVFCADEASLRAAVPSAFAQVNPDVFEYVLNVGADSMSWLLYLERHLSDADYCLKLHTKRPGAWTYMLLQPFVDLPEVVAALEKEPSVALAGRDVFLQPLYFGVSDMYRARLQHELLDKFGVCEEGYDDDLYVREINRAPLRKWDPLLYRDRRPDVARACPSDVECWNHFAQMRFSELIHARHDVAALQTSRRVFVAGNVYLARGSGLRALAARAPLAAFRRLLECEPRYYGNFDHNGTVWRWANALEYLTQAALLGDAGRRQVKALRGAHHLARWSPAIVTAPAAPAASPRALFVSHELTLTGAPLCLLRGIRAFAAEGWRVALVSDRSGEAADAFAEACAGNVWILSSKPQRGNVLSKERAVADAVRIWRPDLVLLNTVMTAFALRPAAFAAHRPRVAACVHESAWDLAEASHCGAVADWRDWSLCERIFCVNEMLREALAPYAPTVALYNDVDLQDEPRTRCEGSYVAGSGTLEGRRKGFDLFCEVARRFPRLAFRWAGTGSSRCSAPDNVVVASVPHDKMPDFWKSAVCFLCTSRSEAFSLAAFEAQCAGTQVILAERAMPVADLKGLGFITLAGPATADGFAGALRDFRESPSAAPTARARRAVTGNTAALVKQCAELVAGRRAGARRAARALAPRAGASIHGTFPGYCLAPDLIRAGLSGADDGLAHYMRHGFAEGRPLCRSFCPFKPVVLFGLP